MAIESVSRSVCMWPEAVISCLRLRFTLLNTHASHSKNLCLSLVSNLQLVPDIL